ncbi:MAG: right-handed parallel beta-helix repeat-containing protein [Bacteroidaceae bacterium]|nr:right-handed parallel beta-helix repeat-containing protein [Bacteroidaceae bacterium]
MRKVLITMMVLFAAIAVRAQNTVGLYDSFWDGRVFWTASEIDESYGTIHFEGYDIDGNEYQFDLMPGRRDGQYFISGEDDIPALRAKGGWEVDYVDEDGMRFLAPKNPQGRIVNTLTFTEDGLYETYGQSVDANQEPVSDMIDGYLMDAGYLSRFSPEELREMRAQLKESNNQGIIVRTNLQLVENELEIDQKDRFKPLMSPSEWEAWKADNSADYDEEEGDDFAAFVDITVSNAAEFIDALGSNRTVRIADGVTIDLTPALNDPEIFVGKYNDWVSDMYAYENEVGEYAIRIVSEEVYDGRQLTLKNINNLTIIGGLGSKLIVEPRYACVINLWRCSSVRIQNLVMGHTEEGVCVGGVIGMNYCYDTQIYNCDLYGCGTYGIVAENSSVTNLVNSIIRDCSEGIVWLIDCSNATFYNCDFFDNAGGVATYKTTDISFRNCHFYRNRGGLFTVDRKIMLDGCEMWHPEGQRGNENVLSYEEEDYIWNNDRGEGVSLRPGVGPRKQGEGGLNEDGR